MDFRSYVRDHLPALRVVREEEIVEELAQHLDDVYRDGRAAGLEHEAAWAQATATLPKAADELAAALRNASRAPTARCSRAFDVISGTLFERSSASQASPRSS